MERYASNVKLCEAFANLKIHEIFSSEGQTKNMFFQDGKLYSFGTHFIVAQYKQDYEGRYYIALTNREYSHTTSQHKKCAKAAILAGTWDIKYGDNL